MANPSRIGVETVTQIGALATAVAASACCWLPLLLMALGISGGALAATFGAWRPVLLPVALGLLGLAFYLTYRRPGAAARPADDACCPPGQTKARSLRTLHQVTLCGVTLLVLALAFFPTYAGSFLGSGTTPAAVAGPQKIEIQIEGMTCDACAASLQTALANVPGVSGAVVDYATRRATVTGDGSVTEAALQKAVTAAGYRTTVAHRPAPAG